MRNTIQHAIDAFLDEIRLRPSKETPHTYASALRAFQLFLRGEGIDPRKSALQRLTVDHFLGVPHYLKREHFRKRPNDYTIATYLAVYLSWLRFLIRQEMHPALGRGSERIRAMYRGLRPRGRRLPRALTDREVRIMVRAAYDQTSGRDRQARIKRLRDIALVHTLRCAGGRIGEVVGAVVEDLDSKNRSLRITGKGNRQRLLFFDRFGWDALMAYLDKRGKREPIRSATPAPIFCRHNRGSGEKMHRLSQRGARNVIQALAKDAGIRERVSPHRLRHFVGKRILEKTGDLAATQDLLGHASPVTTRIYSHLVASRLREAHRKAFPE
ncbi:MAG: tyrosine-type recombinase/integrase [Nitrospirae bacterium]|nr:tyrosine-type recombinase/integrase [Nitrospirota bacterium]